MVILKNKTFKLNKNLFRTLIAKQFGVLLHLLEVLLWFLLIVGLGNSPPLAVLGLLPVEPVLVPVDVNPARDVRKHSGRVLDVTLQLTDAGAQLRVGPRPGLPPQRRIDGLCPIVAQGPLLN